VRRVEWIEQRQSKILFWVTDIDMLELSSSTAVSATPPYGADLRQPPLLPRGRLAEGPLPAATAYQLVRDEMVCEGDPRQNLGTFITTGMESHAKALMAEFADRTTVDGPRPGRVLDMERWCVSALADLWHAPAPAAAPGVSTGGSSEACMLAGLALKQRWTARHPDVAARHERLNLVMGPSVHVCWTKFCDYWDIEARQIPADGDRLGIDPQTAAKLCDELTIGVVTVLGTTFDGTYEPVAEVCAELDDLQDRQGIDVPVHVDAASGGMVAPFLDPALRWDFRLPRVTSINTSGHKYGLVYAGLGWVLWRDAEALPPELAYQVNCLGESIPSQTLSFTRPAAPLITQYYMFHRLGRSGYRTILQQCRTLATQIATVLHDTGDFRLLSHGDQLPVVTFTLKPHIDNYHLAELTGRLARHGWLIPTYTLPPNREDLTAARIVIRGDFSPTLADQLTNHLHQALPHLRTQAESTPQPAATCTLTNNR
jgi:glutamate decarboxylase